MNDDSKNNGYEFYGPRGIFYVVPAEYDENGNLKVVEKNTECGKMMWDSTKWFLKISYEARTK